jgi:hypothetical protein
MTQYREVYQYSASIRVPIKGGPLQFMSREGGLIVSHPSQTPLRFSLILRRWTWVVALLLVVGSSNIAAQPSNRPQGLVAHWAFEGDYIDSSGNNLHAMPHGTHITKSTPRGSEGSSAVFDGRSAWLEVPNTPFLDFNTGDFSIAGWFDICADRNDLPGDLISKYDPESRTGFQFGIQHSPGVTTTQANTRNLFFGINAGKPDNIWLDRGRPGNNHLVYALCVWKGGLFAGTYEEGANEAGCVYRYEGEDKWTFCGKPDICNSVTSLCVFKDHLYAAVSDYDASGSKLGRSPNRNPGGKVYRYNGGTEWIDCGRLGNAPYIFGMAEFEGSLYATLLRSPNPTGEMQDLGLYRYDDEQKWTYCSHPGGRVCALTPYNGGLYATGYDGDGLGGVFRYESDRKWTNCGVPGKTTQTYSFAFHEGRMYVGTWPEGKVYRYEKDGEWTDCGQLGEEQEVMGMSLYNGDLYAGTLPLAQVYRYNRGTNWVLSSRLDLTPDVIYRRAWSMAVYEGQLFCGVLPSGHVHSLESGKVVSMNHDLGTGWKHIVAVRSGDRLRLYVDGEQVAQSTSFIPLDYNINNIQPMRIGLGANEFFNGKISDLQVFGRALKESEISALYGSE